MPDDLGGPMPEPVRIAIELLAPLMLAGLPLPTGTVLRLGADVALHLLHLRRARLAPSHRAAELPRLPPR